MIISRCHKVDVYVEHGHEGTSYYVCELCNKAADVISSFDYAFEGADLEYENAAV